MGEGMGTGTRSREARNVRQQGEWGRGMRSGVGLEPGGMLPPPPPLPSPRQPRGGSPGEGERREKGGAPQAHPLPLHSAASHQPSVRLDIQLHPPAPTTKPKATSCPPPRTTTTATTPTHTGPKPSSSAPPPLTTPTTHSSCPHPKGEETAPLRPDTRPGLRSQRGTMGSRTRRRLG